MPTTFHPQMQNHNRTPRKPLAFIGNFRLQIVLRIIAVSLSMLLFVWLVTFTSLYASITIVLLVIVAQIWSLVYFAEQTNRHLMRFLESVRYGDTINIATGARLGASFQELTEAFGSVVQDFERIRREKEEQYLALQTILHHISIGLMSFDADGNVEFINPSARRLLGISQILSLRSLRKEHSDFVRAIENTANGDTILVKLVLDEEILQLAVSKTHFRQQGKELTLVSLQNIVSELEEQEISAWQKLIRVLTHEIMNSIAPITSLAQTVSGLLSSDIPQEEGEQTEFFDDIRSAVETISRRSEGLLAFVENYRRLSRIPEPDFNVVRLAELFARLEQLFSNQCAELSITLEKRIIPQSIEILGDIALLEQVFINLLQNAIHAIIANDANKPRTILLTAFLSQTARVCIDIQDTGTGIVPEALEKIFIPFFTTKPDGSGIGLSVARQVIRKHGASMTVSSEPGEGTTFHIRF